MLKKKRTKEKRTIPAAREKTTPVSAGSSRRREAAVHGRRARVVRPADRVVPRHPEGEGAEVVVPEGVPIRQLV